MASGRAGSLESLRRLNRLRVIHALRDQGLISRAEIARRTGLSRSTVSSLVSDLQADGLVVERARARRGTRHPGRAAADPALVRLVGRRRRRHRLRAQPPARRGLGPARRGSWPSARCRSTPTTPRRRASTRRRSWWSSCSAEAGIDAEPGHRGGDGPARPDPPGGRRGRLGRDPARLGRRAGGGRHAQPAARSRSSSTTTRTSALSPRPRSAPLATRATWCTSRWPPGSARA